VTSCFIVEQSFHGAKYFSADGQDCFFGLRTRPLPNVLAFHPERLREAFEVDLIDLVEDRHHGRLNDFVLNASAIPSSNTINQQFAVVRRLAHEAADAGLLSPELAAGVKGNRLEILHRQSWQ
jgi:hypothetical protein